MNSLWLVRNNVPFDVAFGCEDDFRLAATVVMAGFEGWEFDWTTGRYRKAEPA